MRVMDAGRYHRQTLLPEIGRARQERLGRARVLLVGCGALGCVIAEQLSRACLARSCANQANGLSSSIPSIVPGDLTSSV